MSTPRTKTVHNVSFRCRYRRPSLLPGWLWGSSEWVSHHQVRVTDGDSDQIQSMAGSHINGEYLLEKEVVSVEKTIYEWKRFKGVATALMTQSTGPGVGRATKVYKVEAFDKTEAKAKVRVEAKADSKLFLNEYGPGNTSTYITDIIVSICEDDS